MTDTDPDDEVRLLRDAADWLTGPGAEGLDLSAPPAVLALYRARDRIAWWLTGQAEEAHVVEPDPAAVTIARAISTAWDPPPPVTDVDWLTPADTGRFGPTGTCTWPGSSP